MKISALIHTKNAQTTIKKALESIKWADEIVIIDMHSTDATRDICQKYTDKIYDFEDVGYVEPARNFGISKTTGDWILILDADEEIPHGLAGKLKELIEDPTDVWQIPRKNILFGHWMQYAGWWPDYNVRFFRKGKVEWSDKVHSIPKVSGKLGKIPDREELAILHHNYPNVTEFVSRMNKYTSLTAAEMTEESSSALSSFWNEFQSRFLAQKGYKDGAAGLHASLLQSFYEAIVAIKRWEANKAPDLPINVGAELTIIIQQIAYWRADYMINHSFGLTKLYWRIRRKIKK